MSRGIQITLIALSALFATQVATAQVAGKTTLGVAIAELEMVAAGWSAKKQILGQIIENENGEKIGRIDDLIVAPYSAVSFVIVGTGGFIGVNRHHVAIPADQLAVRGGQFLLIGATKAAIKALPPFEYEN